MSKDLNDMKQAFTIGWRTTDAQWAAIDRLKEKGWSIDLSLGGNLLCEDAIAVHATQGQTTMWLVIEPDGYTHS